METMGTSEAKRHFSQLLARVANGEQIVLSKRGVPVAVLQPVEPVRETIAELKRFRNGRRLGGLSVREMLNEGRP